MMPFLLTEMRDGLFKEPLLKNVTWIRCLKLRCQNHPLIAQESRPTALSVTKMLILHTKFRYLNDVNYKKIFA